MRLDVFLRRGAAALVTALLAAGLAAAPAQAEPEAYEIDPEHFSVAFMVSHLGFQNQIGLFLDASGSFTFDGASQVVSDVRIEIDADSVFTDHKRRDRHLRSPDFLNAREFPKIVFVGTSAEKLTDTTGRIHGELELLGQKRPITVDIELNQVAVYPFGHKKKTIGMSARASFRRSEFAMTYGTDALVGDDVQLMFEFEALKQ